MNVISYINGDTEITDYPACSARPLARMVQNINDLLADPDGFLSPENSVLVLDLGWRTVGTSEVSRAVQWAWLADLLTDPEYGVVKYAHTDEGIAAISRVAELCKRESVGDKPSYDEWQSAASAAHECRNNASYAPDAYAAYAAYAPDAAAADVYAAAYAAYTYAAYAAAYAAAADVYAAAYAADAYAGLSARIEFTRWAIERWRELAGLDDAADIDPVAVDSALVRINA